MATKKKKKAEGSRSTALVRRSEPKPGTLAAFSKENRALKEELTLVRAEMADMQRAMLTLADRVKTGPTEAPPPLFEYNLDVDLLRDHDVLLVSSEIKNTGMRELAITSCTLVVDSRAVREMDARYREDIELEGCVWANGRDVLQSGLIETYAWAFENVGDVGSAASVCLRIGGLEILESVNVRKFDADRPASARKSPKLLTAGSKSTVNPKTGLDSSFTTDGGRTEDSPAAPTNESVWRS